MNRTKEETVALSKRLARVYPGAPWVLKLATIKILQRTGRAADRAGEAECNRQPVYPDEFHDKRKATSHKARTALAQLEPYRAHPVGVTIEVGGDPRGYCLKLHHPAIGGNTWGGDVSGWGIN